MSDKRDDDARPEEQPFVLRHDGQVTLRQPAPTEGFAFVFGHPAQPAIRFTTACPDGGLRDALTLTHDGRVEVGPGLTPNDAATAFVEALRPQFAEMLRQERERFPVRVIDVPAPPPDTLFERVREEMDREMAKATGPGVAKVEPLTAFERLERAIESLREWADSNDGTGVVARVDQAVEAFDAWKVAREAEPVDPDQERTPAPDIVKAIADDIAAALPDGGSLTRSLFRAAVGDAVAKHLASLRAAPPSERSRGVDRQAAASAHPECSTCALAAKGFDVWCPHMAATSP